MDDWRGNSPQWSDGVRPWCKVVQGEPGLYPVPAHGNTDRGMAERASDGRPGDWR